MVFTDREWIGLLSQDCLPSVERVIAVVGFRTPLRIRREVWGYAFAGVGGLGIEPGAEVELVARDGGGPQVMVPDWAIEKLGLEPKGKVCITKREGHFYLKRLELTERPSEIPGWTVIDTFADEVVTRTFMNRPDLDAIRPDDLRQWLSQMGRLRCDPLAPFQQMKGRIGLLARKTFLGGLSDEDAAAARTRKRAIAGDQQENGSWEDSVFRTASNLIRLLELEATMEDQTLARAAHWLLGLPEPAGLPGLFMLSEELAQRFSEWKAKTGAKGRPHRRESRGELRSFLDSVDYVTNYALDACELRLTWTSALVLEALLRCGLYDEPRVVRAINTLFALSGHGGWCGCGYLDAKVNIPASQEPADFSRFTVPGRNSPHHIDWFPNEKEVLQLVCDGSYHALGIGGRRTLLSKSWHNTGLCTMVMHRALSYHPQYAGSTLEAMDALRLAYCQSACGTWGEMVYLASMMGFLSRLTHPLAAFLVLRSIPLLIRRQGADGLWQEVPIGPPDSGHPSPTKEESSFLILRALKQFGYLEPLLPSS